VLEPWHIISQVHLRRSVTIDHRSASPQRGEAAGKASNLQKEIYTGKKAIYRKKFTPAPRMTKIPDKVAPAVTGSVR
jgi:hypothetical protein